MNRRDFLATTTTAAAAAASVLHADGAPAPGEFTREYYALTRFHLRRGPKQKVFDDFLREALVPALGRMGIGPVGVFNVMVGPESPSTYTLVPYKSLNDFAGVTGRLRDDAEFRKAAAEVMSAPPSDPAYVQMENWLLGSIASVPKIEVPAQKQAGKGRIFELRTYQSHGKSANLKKIEMFDVGETAIFRRAGLAPVFFGEALAGSRLPNLTYMLVYDDMAARDKAWSAFGGDPEWRKLSTTPGFTDAEIVTDITNVLLRPASYSQI